MDGQWLCLFNPFGFCLKMSAEQGNLVWRQIRAMALAFDPEALFENFEDGVIALSYLFGKLIYPQHVRWGPLALGL